MSHYKVYHTKTKEHPLSIAYFDTEEAAWRDARRRLSGGYVFVQLWDGEKPLARHCAGGRDCLCFQDCFNFGFEEEP